MPLPSLSLRRLRSLHPRAVARSVARRPARLVVSAVVLLVLVGGLGAWLLTREQPAAAATVTATVGVETLRETVSAQGTLEPAKGSTLTFPVSGTVTSVRVEPGDTVRRGQVLAVVDDAALVAVRRAAEAGIAEIICEVDRLDQIEPALEAGATRLLLDNMEPDTLREAVGIVAGRVPTEASGGINLDTINAKATTGVDFVSVGRLTQSAPAADIGLDFTTLD